MMMTMATTAGWNMDHGTRLHWVRPETAPLATHVRCTLSVDVGIRMRVDLLIHEFFMSKICGQSGACTVDMPRPKILGGRSTPSFGVYGRF